jgi:hypothetical protein
MMRRWTKRIGWTLLVLLGLLVADYALYPRLAGMGGASHDEGRNGLWVRYTWYFGERKLDEVPALAKRLRTHGIRYAFFHVRFIKRDGTLAYRYPDRARALNRAVAREAPGVKRIAWIYAGNPQGIGDVDLADPHVRAAMVREAVWLVRDCGFDGVQWDYEICPDGDPNLPRLLDETRSALPKKAFLGVAAAMCYPWPLAGFGWSDAYFGELARRCDQIAVMGYDSGLWLPRAYVGFIRAGTERITKAVTTANPNCTVLMGLPTYEAGGPSHHAHAESLRMGLKGVRDSRPAPSFEGVALFADYTTDESEWSQLRQGWQRGGEGRSRSGTYRE